MAGKKSTRTYNRFRYSQEDLKNALRDVREGFLSACKASKQYHVPKGTLIKKLHESVPIERRMGPATVLTKDEEERIEDWIMGKAKVGYAMHAEDVKDAVQKILKDAKRINPFTDCRPGRKWMELFLKRHPDIRKKQTEIISKGRASVTETKIREWFAEIKEFLVSVNATDILDDPCRIFNSDETGVQLCPKSGKLLGPKSYKNFYEIASGSEKECVTVLCTFSANGESVDPLIVYPYKRIPAAIAQTLPEGVAIGRSDSGWMVSSTFYEYMSNVFYPWLLKRRVKFPVLFFQDGHKSHINLETAEFCNEKQIHLVCLYPNATHILQPCDVAIFRPLKVEWKKVVRAHRQTSSKNITKGTFAPLFIEAYKTAIKQSTIQNGFRACGLYPYNPDNVDFSKCIGARWQSLSQDQNVSHDQDNTMDEESFARKLESLIPDNVLMKFREFKQTNTTPTCERELFSIWEKCQGNDKSVENIDSIGTDVCLNNQLSEDTQVVLGLEHLEDISEIPEELRLSDITDFGPITLQQYETGVVTIQKIAEAEIVTTVDNTGNECLILDISLDNLAEIHKTSVEIDDSRDSYSEVQSHDSIGLTTELTNSDKCTDDSSTPIGTHSPHTTTALAVNIENGRNSTCIMEKIWKEHLHWPSQDTQKKEKKNTERSPFVISSTAFRIQCHEKIRVKQEQDRERQRKKLEIAKKKEQKQKLMEEKRKKKAEIARQKAINVQNKEEFSKGHKRGGTKKIAG